MWNTLVFSFPFLTEMEASIYKWNDQIALQGLNLYDLALFSYYMPMSTKQEGKG